MVEQNSPDHEDKINQQVTLSDHAQAGNITLIGKIVNVIQRPSLWQDALWSFASKHWKFLLVACVLQVILLAAYLPFRNLYLIPLWLWGLGAVLLLVAAWSWNAWIWAPRTRSALILSIAVTMFLAVTIGSQAWSIAFPQRFDPQTFSIAIAELGEGASFEHTGAAKEISDQIYERVCEAVRNGSLPKDGQDPCGPSAASEHLPLAITRLGVIPDSQTAKSQGDRIGASIVIWGQLLSTGTQGVTIRFQVVETLDKAVNPEFPLVLPVTSNATEIVLNEQDLKRDPNLLKELIARQSLLVSTFVLGLDAYLNRDTIEAVTNFETAAKTLPASQTDDAFQVSPDGQSLLFFYLGRSYSALAQFDDAKTWLTRARLANPREPAVPLGLALVYGSLGQIQDRDNELRTALDLTNTWLQLHPEDNPATYNRGIIYQILGKHEFALLDFDGVVKRDPRLYIAYISAGQEALALGKFDQARERLGAAIQLADQSGANSSWAHLNLAIVNERDNQAASAKSEYLKAIQVAPDVDWMYYYAARFLETQNEMDAAAVNFQKLAEISRNKNWGYSNLAAFQKRRGLLHEAVQSYEQAILASPKDALAHTYLAETLMALGRPNEAVSEYDAAIASNDKLYYVHASYGGALYQLGKFDLSAQEYEISLKLRPLDDAVMLNLGQTYEALKEINKAKDLYSQIVKSAGLLPKEAVDTARDRLRALGVENP